MYTHVGTILRGPNVTDPLGRPDAELWLDGRLIALVMDRKTAGEAETVHRLESFRGYEYTVLWLCADQARREELRQRVGGLRSRDLFATLASPHAAVWRDVAGGRVALAREATDQAG